MIDPPSLPVKPDFPNRMKLCGVGLGIGVVLGCPLAGGTEFLDDRIHSEKAFKQIIPVAVISEIPLKCPPSTRKLCIGKDPIGWPGLRRAWCWSINFGGKRAKLFAGLAWAKHVQSFLQSATKPIRDQPGSVVSVSYQETQRGAGGALLRSAAAQGFRGHDGGSGHRQDPAGPLPVAVAESK